MIQILEISISLILFTNKILLLFKKKEGWILGAIGCALAILYFYLINLYVFTTLEIGLVVLMIYGYIAHSKTNPRIEKLINSMITICMLVMSFFAYSGMMTVFELISSSGLLFGTYFLTHNRKKIGWGLYCLGHLVATYLGHTKEQYLFAFFQFASVIVSLEGIRKIKK